MTKIKSIESRRNAPQEEIDKAFFEMMQNEPNPIFLYVPDKEGADEQKAAFLAGDIDQPRHTYGRVDTYDFDSARIDIESTTDRIITADGLNGKFQPAFEEASDDLLRKLDIIELSKLYREADDPDERQRVADLYTQKNIEQYGEPDEALYRTFLSQKLDAIAGEQLTGRAAELRDELMAMVDIPDDFEPLELHDPSPETVKWLHDTSKDLYGNLLRHVPEDKDSFGPYDIKDIFDEIMSEEFEDSADGWVVEVTTAGSITVNAGLRKIIIPETRKPSDRATMRKLVVHEIGVHFLRAVTGDTTDLPVLQRGHPGYYDFEEGLGVVMEQALEGTYERRGIEPYITVGAIHVDGKNFRETFEMKWRLAVLAKAQEGDVTDKMIEDARTGAYTAIMRIMRGTDELPFMKDLGYQKSDDVWEYIDSIRGDDLQFMTLLATGRIDSSDIRHRRLAYETATR